MKQVVPEGRQGAVDMRALPAGVAIVAREARSAVQAIPFMGVAIRADARAWLDGPRQGSARHRVANRFQIRHHPPFGVTIMRASALMLAAAS